MSDPFDLQRFVSAQESVYRLVVEELRQGKKRSHWMWFIFPQVEGLGHSSMARHFAIRSREEANAYLAMPVLGARLVECTSRVMAVPDKSAHEIFGSPDDLKFRSSITLFDAVDCSGFYEQAIVRFFGGQRDEATLKILKQWRQAREIE